MQRLKKLHCGFCYFGNADSRRQRCRGCICFGQLRAPKVRNAGQNAKIELYHLGKRLVLKRLNPSDAKLTKEQQSEQQAQLARLNTLIQQKHLKSVALGHLSALNARELQAVVLYLTTRYGVTTR